MKNFTKFENKFFFHRCFTRMLIYEKFSIAQVLLNCRVIAQKGGAIYEVLSAV